MKNNRVTMGKELVEAKQTGKKMKNDVETPDPITMFSVRDQKVMRSVFSLISPDDTELREFRLTIPELMAMTGVSDMTFYKEIYDICMRLMCSAVSFKTPDNPRGFEIVTIFSLASYRPDEGYVLFKINEYLMPYLVQLHGRFTTYYLNQITPLKSAYSIRMYEILRQFLPLNDVKKGRQKGHRKVAIADLRGMLGVPEKKYRLFSRFRVDVIEKTQKELEEKTDLKFTFQLEKRGRTITGINFTIYPNVKFEPVEESDEAKQGDHIPGELSPLSPAMAASIRLFVSDQIPDQQMLQLGMYEEVVLRGALTAFLKTNRPRNPIALFLHIVTATDLEYRAVVAKTGQTEEYDPWDTSWADKYDFGLWDN